MPSDVFEVLGRAPLAGRQQAQIVRFGDKLILLAVSATGVDSIGEVDTPEEVDRIVSACQSQRGDSISNSFQQVLSQFAREPAPNSFLGEDADNDDRTGRETSEFERLA